MPSPTASGSSSHAARDRRGDDIALGDGDALLVELRELLPGGARHGRGGVVTATDVPAGLMFETPPDLPETVNFLLYGPPKTGKTSTAATAPGPNLWVNAEGPGALAYARKIAAQRGNEILEVRITRRATRGKSCATSSGTSATTVEPVPATVTSTRSRRSARR
jgi:hypothetical protein